MRPRVEREGLGWKVVSPNCSRTVDPAGGEIDIAWLVPASNGHWLLHARDHAQGCWVLKASGLRAGRGAAALVRRSAAGVLAMNSPIYLDHNATTQPAPEVMAEMLDALQLAWANPSSTHAPGQAARRLLADARARVAAFLGCQGAELVFTSGATEANHMAVLGALAAARASGRRRLVLSAVEHPGLLALAQRLADEGVPVDLIPVDAQGRLDLASARALIGDDVALVSVMGANNETGVLMPLREMAELAHAQRRLAARRRDAARRQAGVVVRDQRRRPDVGVGAQARRAQGRGRAARAQGRWRCRRCCPAGRSGTAAAAPRTCPASPASPPPATAPQPRWPPTSRACRPARAARAGPAAGLPALHLYGRDAQRLPNTSCLRFGTLDAEQVLSRLERAGVVARPARPAAPAARSPRTCCWRWARARCRPRPACASRSAARPRAADIDDTLAAAQRAIAPLLEPQPLAA